MIEQLRRLYTGVAVHATEDAEHEAALSVLVLTMLSDRRLRLGEQDEIELFVDDAEWESDTFSLGNRLGPASAKAREALTSVEATDAMLTGASAIIASSVLRSQLVAACRDVADADHERAAAEDSLLAKIERHFA